MGLASCGLQTPCVPKGRGLAAAIKNREDDGGGCGDDSENGDRDDKNRHVWGMVGLLHQAP